MKSNLLDILIRTTIMMVALLVFGCWKLMADDDLGLLTPVTHRSFTTSPTNSPVFVAYNEILPPTNTCTTEVGWTIPDGMGFVSGLSSPPGEEGEYIGPTKPIFGYAGGIVISAVGYVNCSTGETIERDNAVLIYFYNPIIFGKDGRDFFIHFRSTTDTQSSIGMDYGTVRTAVNHPNGPVGRYRFSTKAVEMGVRD
jgi:hypothetical protein